MAIKPAAASSQALLRSAVTESIEDPVSTERMTQAVTAVPCGHIFNEDTVIQCLARDKLCPLDRQKIERYVPNYNIRHLAERADENALKDEGPTEEAKAQFLRGKELSDHGKYEEAIPAFLQALQLCPTYDKANAFLDFCLKSASKPSSRPPAAAALPVQAFSQDKGKSSPSSISKEKYTELLFSLLEESPIQENPNLKRLLAEQVEELMNQDAEELTPSQQESYKWTTQLFINHKVRQFVADKLQQIHGKKFPQLERRQAPSPSPQLLSSQNSPPSPATVSALPVSAPHLEAQPPANPKIPAIAFGKDKWAEYIGDVGVEPPLPPDIDKILQSPCPFFPGKRVEETHLLTLIPKTVNGKPLTLNSLEELVQHPKKGSATNYNQYYWDEIKQEYGNTAPPTSYWALFTKDVIPESRSKSYDAQKQLVASYSQKAHAPYEVPHLLEAAVSIFMEYLQTGKKLYSDSPYTRCQERVSSWPTWPLVVGGFAADGLHVSSSGGMLNVDPEHCGVGGLRKF